MSSAFKGTSVSSLRAGVMSVLKSAPQLANVGSSSRERIAQVVALRIAEADPDQPMSVEEAEAELEALARQAGRRESRGYGIGSRSGELKVHHLRSAPRAKSAKTRVGRGEGSKGKTAGRGTKGTKARYSVPPGLEGGQMPLHMRTPKLRGFKNPFRVEYQVVNLDKLAELYPQGGDVTVADLVAKGAVRENEKVKVLGNGEIAVALTVSVDKVSGSAEQKIVAAGGTVQ